jgi:ubiquinol-cytochrome c reductase cytochrome b subunit
MVARLRDWFYDRSAIDPESFSALDRPVAKGAGWWNTLGSASLLMVVLLCLTGAFLSLYYSPHPDAAYESTRYIDRELPGGRLVHGLHLWATSGLVVLMGLHLVRTYVQGAYKPPREIVWVLGVLLLALLMGFIVTGDTLPWDQDGYWAARVRANFPGSLPIVGPAIKTLLLGGAQPGALTLTRFYAIHILLLPALFIGLIAAHLHVAWRKGATAPGSRVGEPEPTGAGFRQAHLLKHAVAMLAAFLVIYALAIFKPADLEFKANPSDATYHARPEWFLLFLFQLLRDAAGVPVPSWFFSVVLPGLGITFLMLAPWIDRGPERSARRRPFMMAALGIGILTIAGFTARAYATLTPVATPQDSLYGAFTERGDKELDPAQIRLGKEAFTACAGCHVAYQDYTKGTSGPDLSGYGATTFLSEVPQHPEWDRLTFYDRYAKYVRGEIRYPNSKMPSFSDEMLSKDRLDAIGAYISQDPARVKSLEHRAPQKG